MAKNKVVENAPLPVNPNFTQWGGLSIETHKTIEVEGVGRVELELTYPAYQKSVKELLANLNPSIPADVAQHKAIMHNARWYVVSLPQEALNPQGITFLGKTLPKWSLTEKIWQAVKSLNPESNDREGNVNWLTLPTGRRLSVGSYWNQVLGLPQSRISPSGGIAGLAHPARFFAVIAPLEGSNFEITSMSPMYDKARQLLKAKQEAQAKAEAEAKAKQEAEAQANKGKGRKK